MSRRIYVASSWRNTWYEGVVMRLSQEHEVYDFRHPQPGNNGFSWAEIDPDWEDWTTAQYVAALQNPRAREGFALDMNGAGWADTCVLVLPCGRSAHLEAGWCAGQGKQLYIYVPTPQEPELMYLLADGVYGSLDALLERLRNAA